MLRCHLQLARKQDMLLVAPFSHHGFGDAVFTGNFAIVVDCLGFCNDFQLEVEVIRVMASAWHITIEQEVEVEL